MRTIVALCLVASALANSVDWSSLESRDHHIQAVKSVKASFPGITRISAHAHDKPQSCCQMSLLYVLAEGKIHLLVSTCGTEIFSRARVVTLSSVHESSCYQV